MSYCKFIGFIMNQIATVAYNLGPSFTINITYVHTYIQGVSKKVGLPFGARFEVFRGFRSKKFRRGLRGG